MSDTDRFVAKSLTNSALAARLTMMTERPRGFSVEYRKALMLEAARRLDTPDYLQQFLAMFKEDVANMNVPDRVIVDRLHMFMKVVERQQNIEQIRNNDRKENHEQPADPTDPPHPSGDVHHG